MLHFRVIMIVSQPEARTGHFQLTRANATIHSLTNRSSAIRYLQCKHQKASVPALRHLSHLLQEAVVIAAILLKLPIPLGTVDFGFRVHPV